ncbi:hypothetical protein B0H63DRAFT_448999 [Podospora didyma]|uniref:Uncharacterized protein n=1 Tax=Podospora didyma TaxID=330526 RepID=A0AAE0NNZ2_9PEZI|nr:hypothetical protein B0H63DRAFT_448999 [Podospora didyma]
MIPTLEQEYELRKANKRISLEECYRQAREQATSWLSTMPTDCCSPCAGTPDAPPTVQPSGQEDREASVVESEYEAQRRDHRENFKRLWEQEQAEKAAQPRRHQESMLKRISIAVVRSVNADWSGSSASGVHSLASERSGSSASGSPIGRPNYPILLAPKQHRPPSPPCIPPVTSTRLSPESPSRNHAGDTQAGDFRVKCEPEHSHAMDASSERCHVGPSLIHMDAREDDAGAAPRCQPTPPASQQGVDTEEVASAAAHWGATPPASQRRIDVEQDIANATAPWQATPPTSQPSSSRGALSAGLPDFAPLLVSPSSTQQVMDGLLEAMRRRLDDGEVASFEILYLLIMELFEGMNLHVSKFTQDMEEIKRKQNDLVKRSEAVGLSGDRTREGCTNACEELMPSVETAEEEEEERGAHVDQGDDDDDYHVKVEFEESAVEYDNRRFAKMEGSPVQVQFEAGERTSPECIEIQDDRSEDESEEESSEEEDDDNDSDYHGEEDDYRVIRPKVESKDRKVASRKRRASRPAGDRVAKKPAPWVRMVSVIPNPHLAKQAEQLVRVRKYRTGGSLNPFVID